MRKIEPKKAEFFASLTDEKLRSEYQVVSNRLQDLIASAGGGHYEAKLEGFQEEENENLHSWIKAFQEESRRRGISLM